MKKICVVISSRANYGSIRSVLIAIKKSRQLKLQVVLSASAILDQYGAVEEDLESLNIPVDERVYTLIDGETPTTMAKSTGLALLELPTVFERLNPDVVFVIGDRFEIMATTIAAAYMNIRVAHSMGGEVTGTIDESIRHSVTKLSHIHFPASEDAYQRILNLGEQPESVHLTGCPRIDTVRTILEDRTIRKRLDDFVQCNGVGGEIDLKRPFVLVSQHPVTTEYQSSSEQMRETIDAVIKLDMQTIVLWPNADAGSGKLAREIRKWREIGAGESIRFFKNFPVDLYMALLSVTSCMIGNSSSGIREGAFIGTPVVNIGSRQFSRARASNVIDVSPVSEDIVSAARNLLCTEKKPSSTLYGNGYASEKIVAVLEQELPPIQKTIRY